MRHRQMLSWHPTEPAKCFALRPGIANEPAFRRGVSLLGRHGRLLEFTLYPYQAEEVARLALDFPNQTFIVNHCGSPIDRDHAGMLRWKKGLKRLGSAPNIKIKISALTAYDPSPTPESLREVALHCIESRGRSIDVRQRLSCRSLMDELRRDLRWLQGYRGRFLRSRAVRAFP